ncbi:MAG: sugar ABC transporter permease [Clostridiales bacterium]|jgi:arabinogalactan oligomer/maltooligosaccharide transport system permease protein|uniref:carbohydrate ABC transporter permease n=1 Tax=Zhenhengia sp. TaxID=2944208 RepID=UPI00290E96D1|nr:sugar ABC transporter permease [Clostridiales bacterium]
MGRGKASKSGLTFRKSLTGYKYLAPALISIGILTLLPILYTIYIAFTDYTIYSQGEYNFVGFQNFIDAINGPFKDVFFPVFGWTVVFAVVSTAGCFLVGLVLAIILSNKNIKEAGFYKGILILPWALPVTVAILSWQGLFNSNYGAINSILMTMHIIQEPIQWLLEPFWARVGILIANIWLGFPYMMNVCMGAISAIPDDYFEAAQVDGANKFMQFIKITLPSIAQTAYPLLISSFAFNFNNFGSAYLITKGGPARLGSQFAGHTDILASTVYKLSTTFGRYDMAATLSIITFLVIGTISFIQMRASGQFKEVD